MRYQSPLHILGIAVGGALAFGMLTGCGSGEPSSGAPAKQASQTTCAEFMQMSEPDQLNMVERAAAGTPGWENAAEGKPGREVKADNGDEPSVELQTATSIVKKNCSQPDAAEKTVADSMYVPRTTTVPTP
ncbi:hypothetical protein OHB26_20670 [Nocardia sp. NBC_01503]|uniref:hypothetical protein n=1 Tax=Nocardia sp. NBC_01503 TaxID=2975997 RepID=UPI002E7B7247|nr:hypothetical protein [Nocardia sp. NBC_01503]WTL29416.1 hypothetical protein OHB26_20670 [Nocardia sp. NBC_01503]